MKSLTNVIIAGGNAEASNARVEKLSAAGFAGLAVSSGQDVQEFVTNRQPDLVLIESAFTDVDTFEMVRRLKSDVATQHVPVVMLNADNSPALRIEGFESGLADMLLEGTPDDVVLARLVPLVRLSTMHAECVRRAATASEFDVPIDITGINNVGTENCRVLLIGNAGNSIDQISDILQADEFNVSVENSHFSAGERLSKEIFDAAVIAVEKTHDIDNAYFLCAHIRNNAKLFNLQVLLVVGHQGVLASDLPYRQGASAAVPLGGDLKDLSISLKFLVRRQRLRWNLHAPISATLAPNSADSLNALYSNNFLRSHLGRLLDRSNKRRRNMSLAIFSLQNLGNTDDMYGPGTSDVLLRHAADWVSGLIRVEDVAARLGPIEICAVFPDTEELDARQATDRIAGVLHHSEIPLGSGRNATTRIWTQSGIATTSPDDSVDSLIARARSNLS